MNRIDETITTTMAFMDSRHVVVDPLSICGLMEGIRERVVIHEELGQQVRDFCSPYGIKAELARIERENAEAEL
jgi:hypothetical protein